MSAVHRLVPLAHVASVPVSVSFYERLGFVVVHSLSSPEFGDVPHWAFLRADRAELMVALATAPLVAREQAVLFHLYTPDLVALRDSLVAKGVAAGPISTPEHMPRGEMRVTDPDGYTLLIGQPDE